MRTSYEGLYIDTETGGFDPKIHALTSISIAHFILRPDQGPVFYTASVQISPHPSLLVTDEALRVQGLTGEQLQDDRRRISEEKALGGLSYWLWNEGFAYSDWEGGAPRLHTLPVWAHSADFDRGFLSAACSRYCPDWRKAEPHQLATTDLSICALAGRDARWSCTRYLAEYLVQKGKLEMPRKPDGTASVSLDPLMERLGIAGRQGAGHDAEEDVRLGVAVLDKLLRLDGWWDS